MYSISVSIHVAEVVPMGEGMEVDGRRTRLLAA
jgi:hypothetical protein